MALSKTKLKPFCHHCRNFTNALNQINLSTYLYLHPFLPLLVVMMEGAVMCGGDGEEVRKVMKRMRVKVEMEERDEGQKKEGPGLEAQ